MFVEFVRGITKNFNMYNQFIKNISPRATVSAGKPKTWYNRGGIDVKFNPQELMNVAPMGRMKKIKDPYVEGSNYIRQSWLPDIRAVQKEIDERPMKLAREYALEAKRKAEQKAIMEAQRRRAAAFERAHQGFSVENMLSNYINRFK
jgi:hypothetical protein